MPNLLEGDALVVQEGLDPRPLRQRGHQREAGDQQALRLAGQQRVDQIGVAACPEDEAAGVGVLRWEMGLVEVGVEPRERGRKIRWCFARC